jgi:hypothetical protein
MKTLLVPITVLALAMSAPAALAQGASGLQDSAATIGVTRVDNAPRRENAVAGIRADREAREHAVGAVALVQQGPPTGQAKLLMVVGGAAFVGGLLVGDDAGTAIAVVGLGIGLYGLYLYMR